MTLGLGTAAQWLIFDSDVVFTLEMRNSLHTAFFTFRWTHSLWSHLSHSFGMCVVSGTWIDDHHVHMLFKSLPGPPAALCELIPKTRCSAPLEFPHILQAPILKLTLVWFLGRGWYNLEVSIYCFSSLEKFTESNKMSVIVFLTSYKQGQSTLIWVGKTTR